MNLKNLMMFVINGNSIVKCVEMFNDYVCLNDKELIYIKKDKLIRLLDEFIKSKGYTVNVVNEKWK